MAPILKRSVFISYSTQCQVYGQNLLFGRGALFQLLLDVCLFVCFFSMYRGKEENVNFFSHFLKCAITKTMLIFEDLFCFKY